MKPDVKGVLERRGGGESRGTGCDNGRKKFAKMKKSKRFRLDKNKDELTLLLQSNLYQRAQYMRIKLIVGEEFEIPTKSV